MSLLQLYPPASEAKRALQGVYLALQLHRQADDGEVLIYSNYIASVDGRISRFDAKKSDAQVPEAIANKRDWRLYQELAAQADVMITSARYFRQLAAGRAQDLLPIGSAPAYHDLLQWRQDEGLKAQPDVMIVSASLDIPVSVVATILQERKVIVITGCDADCQRLASLRAVGVEVIQVAEARVNGVDIRKALQRHHYRSAYMVAGPEVHHTLLSAGVLHRLFLTTHMTLLGGDHFHTLLAGSMKSALSLHLKTLYLDQAPSSEQLFAQYVL